MSLSIIYKKFKKDIRTPQKVIGPNGKNIRKVTSGGLLTTCGIIIAADQALPPAVLIFPRKIYKNHMIKGALSVVLGLASPSG